MGLFLYWIFFGVVSLPTNTRNIKLQFIWLEIGTKPLHIQKIRRYRYKWIIFNYFCRCKSNLWNPRISNDLVRHSDRILKNTERLYLKATQYVQFSIPLQISKAFSVLCRDVANDSPFMIFKCNMRLTHHVPIITIYRFCSQYLTQTFFFWFLYIWSRLLFTILPPKNFCI